MTSDEKWIEVKRSLLERERREVFEKICHRIGCGTHRVSRLILDIVFEDSEWRRLTREIESLK